MNTLSNMRIFVALLLVILNIIGSYSQTKLLRFNHITTEDGLSSSWVRCIYQDKTGFIWFATSDGLNRYDGNAIKAFKADPYDKNSLIHGAVTYIAKRSNNELWICTEQGVSIFNLVNNSFNQFPYLNKVRVTHVLKDHNKITWFSTYSGIFCYNATDSVWHNYRNIPGNANSLSFDQVHMCLEDQDNNFWIATQHGLNLFDRENETFHRYYADESRNSLSGNDIISLVQDRNNRIWIGLGDAGVDLMLYEDNNPLKATFIHVTDSRNNALLIDRNSTLWIGNSMGMGISLIDLNSIGDLNTIPIYNIKNTSDDINSLSDNTISSIMEDRDGGIWIGTFAGGIDYYNPMQKKFNIVKHVPGDENSLHNNVVNCFLEDDHYLWVGTEEGLCRLDRRTGKFKTFLHNEFDPYSIGANGIICMLKDSRGNLWIGTWAGGLNRYSYQQQNFTRFMVDEKNYASISSNNIFALFEDNRGFLWVGTNGGGLNRYDYATGKFKCYKPESDNPKSIYHNAVNDICETSLGELFISVYHALDVFDYNTETLNHYIHNENDSTSLSSGNVIDIFEDSHKNLWIATSVGLNLFNRNTRSFKHFNTKHGLPSNSIMAVNEDDNGNLWLSTNNGLSKVELGKKQPRFSVFHNYMVADGLQGNEFVRRSTYTDENGNLYFGGTKGYTWFHPDSIFNNPIPPEVVITDFRLLNMSDSEVDNLKLTKNINFLSRIVLSYDQSDFIIEFAALNYLNSQKNEYSYILEGYESKWHNVGNRNEATYTNIDPGHYYFKVRGSNNDDVWSKDVKTLSIMIRPPWWNTVLFKIAVIILIIALVYVIYKLRVKILTKQKKILEEKVSERTTELTDLNSLLLEKQEEISIQNEELSKHRTNLEKIVEQRTQVMKAALQHAEEADKLKSAFLANMSHEIRTPMNAIVGFASLINNDDVNDEERKECLDIIQNNCETLMVLINDILEISLIEANQLQLNNIRFSVKKILKELESYFQLNNAKSLEITFKNKRSKKELYINNDSTRFRQVFVNLINNAYKYTEKGQIEFGYNEEKGNITFFVKDTGIGIVESEYENIFNYFHKIDKGVNQLYRGAGIGLSISNKLVELMGGKIWLKSIVGEGTTFFFTFSDNPDMSEVKEKTLESNESFKKVAPTLENKTILVAEDEPANFILIEKILSKTKAHILWAKNGKEAVEMVKDPALKNNCLVLMDIKMPVMNGIRASELIKEYDSTIPVIAVTAYAQHQNKEEILRHNFVDYIPKPLKSQKLLTAVYKHVHS